MDVWNALWPLLALVAGGAVICVLLARRKGNRRDPLRVDELTNLFVDEEDRQDDPGGR